MSETAALGDLVSITRGTTYKSARLGESGPVLLGLASIARNGGFRSDSLKTYGGETPDKLLVRPGELYASLKDVTQSADLLGSVARVPLDGPVGRLTQDTVRLDIVSNAVDPSYLYLSLLTPEYRAYCRRHSTGTTNLGLPREDFLAYPVRLPPLEEQGRIAGVLGALDDLIDTEQKNASTADALWHAVLDHYSGERCELPLSSLAAFVNGRNFTKDASGHGMPVIRTPEIRSGPTESTIRNDAPASADNIAKSGDVLFVWSGSLLVGRWYWERALINQHIFKVIPNRDTPPWLCHWAIEQLMGDFLGVAADKATTMGHIKRADLDREVTVPMPSEWVALDRIIRPLWGEVLDARVHANSLAKIRDELLPLLMSGRVRVREVA